MTGNERVDEALSHREAEAVLEQLARVGFPVHPEMRPLVNALEETERNGSVARDRAETQLQKAEARYHTLVEQIPAITFMAPLDDGLHELYVSPQIEALLGFSQTEWLGDPFPWYRQLHPDDRERWQQEFARTCANGVHFRSEYRFLACDGREVWVHGECRVVRASDGRPLFLQGIAFDITERKRAEEMQGQVHARLAVLVEERTAELARTNEVLRTEVAERQRLEEVSRQRAEQLAEEGRRKDQFLAILAHELRNPLALIGNALEILRDPEARTSTVE